MHKQYTITCTSGESNRHSSVVRGTQLAVLTGVKKQESLNDTKLDFGWGVRVIVHTTLHIYTKYNSNLVQ